MCGIVRQYGLHQVGLRGSSVTTILQDDKTCDRLSSAESMVQSLPMTKALGKKFRHKGTARQYGKEHSGSSSEAPCGGGAGLHLPRPSISQWRLWP